MPALIEQRTGLGGLQLLFAISRGVSFALPRNHGLPSSEKVKVLGVPYKIAYFGYSSPHNPSLEVLPVNLGIRGITDVAKQYLATAGGVPPRINFLASLESRFSWNPVLHHLAAASALWLASQKNSK